MLIPNISYGIFIIGEDISKYLYLPHNREYREEKLFSYDSYDFYKEDIIIWVDNGKIDTIRCEKECYWMGYNLIGMLYDYFLTFLSKKEPDTEDICYVPISPYRGQNQKVYDFDDLGLQIWVWRNRIKTVLISKY